MTGKPSKRMLLGTDEQIAKLTTVLKVANSAAGSTDIDRRFGSFLLYSGVVDFLVIQAARLLEQIVLKEQLARDEVTFSPHDDAYFYDQAISTRSILKTLRKHLPFRSDDSPDEAEKVTELVNRMIERGLEFLNYRIPVVHYIGHPTKTLNDVMEFATRAIENFQEFREAHKEFFEAAAPYSFSSKELKHFYGSSVD
jgi:hypothetical protein